MKAPAEGQEAISIKNATGLSVMCKGIDNLNDTYNSYATESNVSAILRVSYKYGIQRRLLQGTDGKLWDERELFLTIQLALKEYKKRNPQCKASIHDLFGDPGLQSDVIMHISKYGWRSGHAIEQDGREDTHKLFTDFIEETNGIHELIHELSAEEILKMLTEDLIKKDPKTVDKDVVMISPREFMCILHAICHHPDLTDNKRHAVLNKLLRHLRFIYGDYKHDNPAIRRYLDFALEQIEAKSLEVQKNIHDANGALV